MNPPKTVISVAVNHERTCVCQICETARKAEKAEKEAADRTKCPPHPLLVFVLVHAHPKYKQISEQNSTQANFLRLAEDKWNYARNEGRYKHEKQNGDVQAESETLANLMYRMIYDFLYNDIPLHAQRPTVLYQ